MKKTLLSILCTLFCLFAGAQSEKTYTEPLVVTINGESTDPQDASVIVQDNGDGTINFVLKNFILSIDGDEMPVGNICVENIAVEEGEDGLKHFAYNGGTVLQEGDSEGVSEWMGPAINVLCGGSVPLDLRGKMNGDKLYVTIDIDLQAVMQQIVYVELGTDDFPTPTPPTPVDGKVYTEPLVVTINGNSYGPQDANVIVQDNGDGTINFVLKNFILSIDGDEMPVGNICVENIAVEEGEDGLKHFAYNGGTVLQEGDSEGVSEWMGPAINVLCGGSVPLDLRGKMNGDKLYVTIDIDLQAVMQQIVYVQVGTDDFPTPGVIGDANGDGEVDIADVTYILSLMAESSNKPEADANGDGKVDIADVTYVLSLMANEEHSINNTTKIN